MKSGGSRAAAYAEVARLLAGPVVDGLSAFIRIPNQSPMFEPDWASSGHTEAALRCMEGWVAREGPPGARLRRVADGDSSPVLVIEVPGDETRTVVLYGHLDKQPPGEGWTTDGPRSPSLSGGRLFGRGAADDGYAGFVAVAALSAVARAELAAARAVVVLETSEESGSGDFMAALPSITEFIGTPTTVVVLDSVAPDLERLWTTTSLRGGLTLDLTVATLTEAAHSGNVGGLAPSPIVVAGELLTRLAPPGSDWISLPALHREVPPDRRREAVRLADVLGSPAGRLPLRPRVRATDGDPVSGLLRTTWQPVVSVVGMDGVPPVAAAPNAVPAEVTLRLSLRLPPTVDPEEAAQSVVAALRRDPPFGAEVAAVVRSVRAGWNAPPVPAGLQGIVREASRRHFGNDAESCGVGGGIPLVNVLAGAWPNTPFLVTGLLDPRSNPHGPDESVDLEAARRLACCLVDLLVEAPGRSGDD